MKKNKFPKQLLLKAVFSIYDISQAKGFCSWKEKLSLTLVAYCGKRTFVDIDRKKMLGFDKRLVLPLIKTWNI